MQLLIQSLMQPLKERGALLWLYISSRLPLWTHHILGQFIGFCLWVFPTKIRHITLTNIRYCYSHLSSKQQRHLAKQSLRNTVLIGFEIPSMWRDPTYWVEHKITAIEGRQLLDDALATQNGVIIVMPHLGNWELLGLYLAGIAPTVSLYNPPKIMALHDHMKAAREKTGATLVPTNNRGVAQLLKNLRKGGMTCILPDQVPNKSNGYVSAPFFGKDANTMTLVNGLVKKTGCTILSGCAIREHNGFRIVLHKVCESLSNDDAYISACGLNASIEQAIRLCPEQYQWSYKRFKYQDNAY